MLRRIDRVENRRRNKKKGAEPKEKEKTIIQSHHKSHIFKNEGSINRAA